MFPEISKYVNVWSQEEQTIFQELKSGFSTNTLVDQLRLVTNISSRTNLVSNMLLFTMGKLLYNLSLSIELENKLIEYNNNNFLFTWQGFSLVRKGKYEDAEVIFRYLLEEEEPIILITSKIGLARIDDRRGKKQQSIEKFIKIKEEIDQYISGEQQPVFLDLLLSCIYGELWAARTERNVEDSKRDCLENLTLAEQYGDRIHIARLNALLGILEKYSSNWGLSQKYLEKASYYYKVLEEKRGEASTLSNLADVERMQGNLESAEEKLLSVIPLYQKWNEKRSIALVHSNLGEIYAQKRQIASSISEFILAKSLLEEIGAKDELVDYSIAELYLEQKNIVQFNKIIGEVLKDKTADEIEQNPHIMYFFGKKEIVNLNISKGQKYLNKSLNVAVKKGMDHLTAKIIIDLIQVILFDYLSNSKEEDLEICSKLLEDLKIYTIEKQPESELKPILLSVDSNCKKISQIKNISEKRRLVLETQKIMRELVDLIRFNVVQEINTETIFPNQIIVLHRSGIPLKKYLKNEKIVDDILLFGGMVRAAKDIITEIFSGEMGRVMKIDYGENIVILAEFGLKETGIVMITRKDTFHQRRALHESVKELNYIEYPDKYHGEINNKLEQEIDVIVFKWFGEGYIGER